MNILRIKNARRCQFLSFITLCILYFKILVLKFIHFHFISTIEVTKRQLYTKEWRFHLIFICVCIFFDWSCHNPIGICQKYKIYVLRAITKRLCNRIRVRCASFKWFILCTLIDDGYLEVRSYRVICHCRNVNKV